MGLLPAVQRDENSCSCSLSRNGDGRIPCHSCTAVITAAMLGACYSALLRRVLLTSTRVGNCMLCMPSTQNLIIVRRNTVTTTCAPSLIGEVALRAEVLAPVDDIVDKVVDVLDVHPVVVRTLRYFHRYSIALIMNKSWYTHRCAVHIVSLPVQRAKGSVVVDASTLFFTR